jgi:Na+-transporting NADH:ubiquinone oxidoreductase subunit A
VVKIGQPLVEDKSTPGRFFVSPAAGVTREIKRGAKRALLDIIIDVSKNEEFIQWPPMDVNHVSREDMIRRLLEGGAFAKIHSRPFNLLANPQQIPRSIFVKCIESAPFVPPAELQVAGYEADFQAGLTALSKLTSGPVHLVYRKDSMCEAFTQAEHVEKHTAEGLHPVANQSLHIQKIDRIRSPNDLIWTLNAHDVVLVGHLLRQGRYFVQRTISIAGPGALPDRLGYFKVREGFPVTALISGRIQKGLLRFVSGDPLTGHRVTPEDFLGYDDYVFSVIPENTQREFLHFFRLGLDKYTFSGAYMSGHRDNRGVEYDFTTSLHGEHRPFIDSTLYDKVMPLDVPTMLLVKAIMSEDFELADSLGILEVDSEDFALPTFVCPSKMEMTEIVKRGLKQYAKEVLQ